MGIRPAIPNGFSHLFWLPWTWEALIEQLRFHSISNSFGIDLWAHIGVIFLFAGSLGILPWFVKEFCNAFHINLLGMGYRKCAMLTDRMMTSLVTSFTVGWMNAGISKWLNNKIHAEVSGSEHQNHLEDLLKNRLLGPIPKFLVQSVWNGAQDFAFLTSSQVMLMLLAQEAHTENHWHKPSVAIPSSGSQPS